MELLELDDHETSILAEIAKDFINAGFHIRKMGRIKDWEVNLCSPSIIKFLEYYKFETSIPGKITYKREFLENIQFREEITLYLMKYFAWKYLNVEKQNAKRKEIGNLGGWLGDVKVWNEYIFPIFLN